MSLSLLERGKISQDEIFRAVVEVFVRNSPILERIPFMDIKTDVLRFNREAVLPSAEFRSVNSDYTEKTGELDMQTESLAILGGCVDVDRVLERTSNIISARAIQTQMQAKAISLRFTKQFLKGDCTLNPREFDGLQARIGTGSQSLAAGSTSGGDTLTLAMIDELLDMVDGGANAIICNATMRRKINSLIRATGSAYELVGDAFGRQLLAYAGVPILVVDYDDEGNQILAFDEAAPGGGSSVCTSIYAVRFDLDGLCGLQCGDVETIDHGLIQGRMIYRTTLEWLVSICILHPRAVSRLYGLKNA